MILPLLLASLVDIAPGLVWNDNIGLLPTQVDPVPVQSLRATRSLAGECYGVFSAATERCKAYDPEVVVWMRNYNFSTNNFGEGSDEGNFSLDYPRLAATNRTVSTMRIADSTVAPDALKVLADLAIHNRYASSTRFPAANVPRINWTTNWNEMVDDNIASWMQCAPWWCSCEADPILLPWGQEGALFLPERFPSYGDYTGLLDLDAVKNYEGPYAELYRLPSPSTFLDAWLAELYPADPPTASLLTNNTLRLDRKQLTAMDYACAMYDLNYLFADVDFGHRECMYTRSRSASAAADAGNLSYSYASGGYAVSWNPSWTYQTNMVAVTNYVADGHGEAVFYTSGCSSTNGSWRTVLSIGLATSFEVLTNYVLSVGGMEYYMRQYLADASVTNVSFTVSGLSVPGGFGYSQPTHSIDVGSVGICARKIGGGSESFRRANPGLIAVTETNATVSAYGSIERFATIRESSPQSSYAQDYNYLHLWIPWCQLGWVHGFTAYPLCTRYTADPPRPGWLGGEITHQEWQLPDSGYYVGTNGYLRLMSLQAGLAVEDAAEMCMRDAGHDVRDVAGYLALPDSALNDTKSAALAARLAPTASLATGDLVWDVTEGEIRFSGLVHRPGQAIPIGVITAESSGDAGHLGELPEAYGFAARNLFMRIPMNFLNCRVQ